MSHFVCIPPKKLFMRVEPWIIQSKSELRGVEELNASATNLASSSNITSWYPNWWTHFKTVCSPNASAVATWSMCEASRMQWRLEQSSESSLKQIPIPTLLIDCENAALHLSEQAWGSLQDTSLWLLCKEVLAEAYRWDGLLNHVH